MKHHYSLFSPLIQARVVILLTLMVIGFRQPLFAQCGGASVPVFKETFGTGTGYGPHLTYDDGSGTNLTLGVSSYTYWDPTTFRCGYPVHVPAYCPGDPEDYWYTIASSPQKGKSDWINVPDHTGDVNGDMLIVNAAPAAPNTFYRRRARAICQNTYVTFSAWFLEVNGPSSFGICSGEPNHEPRPANVLFTIKDTLGHTLDTVSTGFIHAKADGSQKWARYSVQFFTGANTSVDFFLSNIAPGSCGNDLAVDDIELDACVPTFQAYPPTGTICLGSNVFFTSKLAAGYLPPFFQWYSSKDNGTTWNPVPGATDSTLKVSGVAITDNGTLYKAIAAGSVADILSAGSANNCSVTSNAVPLKITQDSVTFGPLPSVCQTNGLVDLNKFVSVNSAGSTFSGNGVTGHFFDPTQVLQGSVTSIQYTYLNGSTSCSTFKSANITVYAAPNPTIFLPNGNLTCAGKTVEMDLQGINAGDVIQWFNPAGVQISGANGTIYKAPSSGTYTVTVTNSGGCQGTVKQTVSVNPVPGSMIKQGTGGKICAGGSMTLTTSTPGATNHWTYNNKLIIATNVNSVIVNKDGLYTLAVTNSSACSDSVSYYLTVNPLPKPTVTYLTPLTFCPGGSVELDAGGALSTFVSLQWYNSGVAIAGATGKYYVATTAGSYTLNVTDGNGCVGSAGPVTVTLLPTPPTPVVSASGPLAVCKGTPLVLTVTNFNALYTYQWQKNGIALPNTNVASYTVQASGTYTVKATNNTNCAIVSANIAVTVSPSPVASVGFTTLNVCTNGVPAHDQVTLTTQVSPVGTYTYQWFMNGAASGGPTTATTFSATSTGQYYFTATSSAGCSGSATPVQVTITPKPLPVVHPSQGYTANFCNPIPGYTILELVSGTTYSSYQWYLNGIILTGQTSPQLTVTVSGNYALQVVSASGCVGTSNGFQVNAYPPSVAILSPGGPINLCQGATQTLTANQSGIITWYNGTRVLSQTGSNITISTPGNYYYIFTDPNGCRTTSNVVAVGVHLNPPANIYAKSTSGQIKLCANNALTLHLYDIFPKDSATYEWHHVDRSTFVDNIVQSSAIPNDTTYSVGTNPAVDPGNYYVIITYQPSGCYTKSNVLDIQLDKPPVASIGGGIICSPGPIILNSPPGALFQWYYSLSDSPLTWSPATGATATTGKYAATAPGFYRVFVTDNGVPIPCSNYSDTVRLTEGHHLVVAVTPTSTTICKGSFAQFTASITGGGQTDPGGTFYTYSWFFNGNPVSGGAFNTIGADKSGTWSVHVDRLGYCTGIASGTLTVNTATKPVIAPSPTISACEGTTPVISVTNAGSFTTYTWLRNAIPIPGYTAVATAAYPVTQFGTYSVIGTDAGNGCSDTSLVTTVNFQKLPQPVIFTTGPTIFCEGASTRIYADSILASGKPTTDTFQWGLNTITAAGPYTPIVGATSAGITIANPGYYQVTETSSSGCTGTTNIYIQTFPVTTPVISGTLYLCDSSSTTLTSNITTPGAFEWDFTTLGNFISDQPVITISAPGVYYLISRNASNTNCTKSTSVTITVAPLPVASYVMADSCQVTNTVTFINQSKISDGTVLSYSWNFGDPGSGAANTSTATDGVHLYPAPVLPANYPVTLTVTSAQGCVRNYKETFRFRGAKPVAAFTVNAGGTICAGEPAVFQDKSTITTGSIVKYAWGIYNAAGNHLPIVIDSIATATATLPDSSKNAIYTVFHTVIGNSGCLDITSQNITVSGTLTASLHLATTQVCLSTAPDSLRGGLPKNGTAGGTSAYSGIGVKAGVFYPGVAGVGKFEITYTFVNAITGCTSSAKDSINVSQGPTLVNLSAPPTYKPCDSSVLLTAKGTGAVLYSWYYTLASGVDSLLRSGPQDTLRAITGGNYRVRISNKFGCYTDASIPLTIYPHPVPAFDLAEICSNLVASFVNTSHISDKSALQYVWDFGDPASGVNNTTTSPVPVHQYTSQGTKTVTLTVTSAKGCIQSLARQFMISNVDSLVNFTIRSNAPYCMNEPLVFIDSTLLPNRTIRSYRWIFLDSTGKVLNLTSDTSGVVSVLFPPVTAPTKFTVREMVLTTDGCPLEAKDRTVIINPLSPVTYVREHPRNVCRLDPPFLLTGGTTVPPGQPGKGIYYGDGVANGNFNPLKVIGGDNTVSYIFTNQYGCTTTASTLYTVHDTLDLSPRVTNFNVLEGDQVTLNGIGTLPFIIGPNSVTSLNADSLKWAWTPGTGLSSTSAPVPTLTATVTTTYTLTVTPTFGCPSRALFVVVVHKRLKIPNAFSPNGDGINDTWIIQGIDSYPTAEVFIFNRWGQQLWYSKGYGTPWNGFYNGKPLPMGTYYYLIKLNKAGYEQPLSGPLTIIY